MDKKLGTIHWVLLVIVAIMAASSITLFYISANLDQSASQTQRSHKLMPQ